MGHRSALTGNSYKEVVGRRILNKWKEFTYEYVLLVAVSAMMSDHSGGELDC